MFNYANVLAALVGALILFISILNAWASTQSETAYALLEVLLCLPFTVVLIVLSVQANAKAIKAGAMKKKWLALYYIVLPVLGYLAYTVTWYFLVPLSVRFDFSYPGNTGSFHCVQFYFKEHDAWLQGPSVENWPMQVRFPDLDGDGHYDIEVTDTVHGGTVEFVYLKQNDGRVFWRMTKNDSQLSPGYPPAGLFIGP